MKNKCDECNENLEKDFIMSEFGLPVTVWVCPNSEIYQLYKDKFKRRYHKNGKGQNKIRIKKSNRKSN